MKKYKLTYHPALKKDLKKLPDSTVDHLVDNVLLNIVADPHSGKKLRGSFRSCRKTTVRHQGVSYRIVYRIDDKYMLVMIVMIGPRANFYGRLGRRVG